MNAQLKVVETNFETELKKLERLLAAINLDEHALADAKARETDNRWVASWRFCQH